MLIVAIVAGGPHQTNRKMRLIAYYCVVAKMAGIAGVSLSSSTMVAAISAAVAAGATFLIIRRSTSTPQPHTIRFDDNMVAAVTAFAAALKDYAEATRENTKELRESREHAQHHVRPDRHAHHRTAHHGHHHDEHGASDDDFQDLPVSISSQVTEEIPVAEVVFDATAAFEVYPSHLYHVNVCVSLVDLILQPPAPSIANPAGN